MKPPVLRSPALPATLALLAAWPLALAAADAELERRSFLAEELTAAKSKEFYLVLDADAPSIDLKIDGVRVHRFGLDRAEFGHLRTAGSGTWQWPAVSFRLVSEIPEPERPQIEVQRTDEEDKAADEKIKKALARGQKPAGELSRTAGEKVAELNRTEDPDAPTMYRLQFEPEMVLVVRGEPPQTDWRSRARRARYTLIEGWQGFGLWLADKPAPARVVVHLPPQDARRLFKALTPEIRLLIHVPPAE
jgi:hypothetical protein